MNGKARAIWIFFNNKIQKIVIQRRIVTQFQLKDSFPGCLKATATDQCEEVSIAVCVS